MKRILMVAVLLAVMVQVQAQTADDILAKYFAATGGLANWKALASMKVSGKMSMQGFDLPFEMAMKRPNKQHMVMKVQGMEIVQAYDGTDAWMLNPMMGGKDPVKLTGEEAKDFTEREFEDEFIDYQKKGHEVKLLGKEEIDGVSCFKLELVKNKNNKGKDPVTEIHYIDSENYVPIVQVSYVRTGPAKGTEVRTFLSDYQEVQGFMLPFSTEVKTGGQTVQKMTFEKVELNSAINDQIFAFPKK